MKESKPHAVETRGPLVHPVEEDILQSQRVVVLALFTTTLLVCVVTGLVLGVAHALGNGDVPVVAFVAVAGGLGSFVSALNRIYATSNVFPSLRNHRLLRDASYSLLAYALIPPLVGAIGAVAVYLMFAGQILMGGLFPSFHCTNVCDSFMNYVEYWRPIKGLDYARCLVWGFVAGFSERFVPDILSRLAKDSQDETNGEPVPTARPVDI